ncbi:hypothetical protein MJO29_015692 [Puccinia striiformis f. sp. tritici]|nr:hypothetical protein MJO29_015692 [Puccinia striiformis f. sp. tritici]
MTKTARDLKVHIYEKHLLETKGENALMNDRATVDQEIKNWKKLIKAHLEITRKWAEETSSAELVRDNESIVPKDLSVSAQIPKFIFYHIRVHSFVLRPNDLRPKRPSPPQRTGHIQVSNYRIQSQKRDFN